MEGADKQLIEDLDSKIRYKIKELCKKGIYHEYNALEILMLKE